LIEWRDIREFPRYIISETGSVLNKDTGRTMTLLRNQHGIVHVGLVKDGVQHKRSVAVLVAQYFLPRPTFPAFDTPINLDGDRLNNHYANIMWRPLWFARKYHRQFTRSNPVLICAVMEVETEEIFPNTLFAAKRFGLLEREIAFAALNGAQVFPTKQMFKIVR
jgi:hypothetical protein